MSSNPPTPASQCGLSDLISGCARTADIPAGYAGAPKSLAGKFRTFGSELVALRRQSLLTIFNFRFGMPEPVDGDRFVEPAYRKSRATWHEICAPMMEGRMFSELAHHPGAMLSYMP